MFFVAVKKEKPEFLKKPDDIEVMETEDVRFETTIKGKPEPTIQWYVTKQTYFNVLPCCITAQLSVTFFQITDTNSSDIADNFLTWKLL